MSNTGHITWVAPEQLERNWLPEYFAPRFRVMDEALLAGKFQRLGDLVRRSTVSTPPAAMPDWLVRRRGNSMRLERPEPSEGDKSELATWLSLPDECLVLHTMVSRGPSVAAFWSSRIVGGTAATTQNHYVLVPETRGDIAWLEAALSDPLVVAQLDRAALGRFLPHITIQDLFEVRIRRFFPEEEGSASELIRRTLAKRSELLRLSREKRNRFDQQSPSLPVGLPVLTAATFEERIEQFERLLIDEDLLADGNGFFCQAAREDHGSDLFVIREIGTTQRSLSSGPGSDLKCDDDEAVNRYWREWYWAEEGGSGYSVFNSLTGGPDLPSHLLTRTIADPSRLRVPVAGRVVIPAFSDYRSAIDASRDSDLNLDLDAALGTESDDRGASVGELARLWERLNPGTPPTNAVLMWLRSMFRPVLGIRLLRQSRAAGVYLIYGTDQLEHPGSAAAHLEILGERLVTILRQPSRIAEAAARSESLRRLSWMMHQLGGPLTRIGNVVEELVDFAEANAEAAAALLPDEKRARARARMTNLPIEEYTLRARVGQLGSAVEEIRRLRYLIRRYKNAQGELQLSHFGLRHLLKQVAANAREMLPEIHVSVECEPNLVVEADRGLVRYALAEVVSNACRECRINVPENPSMIFMGTRRDARVTIAIEDNALPVTASLLSDPFAEDASTYRSQGKGSGLGLAIVKETFMRHGGRCRLTENTTVENSRRPGVTFSADLAVAEVKEEYMDV